jgi:murein tripeptide amidase MpaA
MKTSSLLCALVGLASAAQACLLPEERDDAAGFHKVVRRQGSTGTPVGTGDRFQAGAVTPRGLGSQSTTFSTLLNPTEIASGLAGLARAYGIKTFETPYKTYEGATIRGAQLGGSGTCNAAAKVYLNGNIHARERGSADSILYFVSDLLYANKNNVGLTYGSKTYTAAQVKTALSAGIVIVPLSNPDGVAYDQRTGSCWRKNRRPSSSSSSVGVDLNRNFDFLWDFTKKFASSVQSSVASTNPSSETYHGTAAFSEPETKSIKWVFDTYSRVRWFIDLHSYAGDVLYSWGSDDNQSNYPYMNFLNSSYDGVRGILSDTPGSGRGYGEYVPSAEGTANLAAARSLASGLTSGGGRTYGAIQASDLYPTSGASDDYSYSRHFADTSLNLVHGYTVEFGFGNSGASCPFYPTVSQYNENMRATNAGFMEFLLAAVNLGLGDGSC